MRLQLKKNHTSTNNLLALLLFINNTGNWKKFVFWHHRTEFMFNLIGQQKKTVVERAAENRSLECFKELQNPFTVLTPNQAEKQRWHIWSFFPCLWQHCKNKLFPNTRNSKKILLSHSVKIKVNYLLDTKRQGNMFTLTVTTSEPHQCLFPLFSN